MNFQLFINTVDSRLTRSGPTGLQFDRGEQLGTKHFVLKKNLYI